MTVLDADVPNVSINSTTKAPMNQRPLIKAENLGVPKRVAVVLADVVDHAEATSKEAVVVAVVAVEISVTEMKTAHNKKTATGNGVPSMRPETPGGLLKN